jgi:hypothetical protein
MHIYYFAKASAMTFFAGLSAIRKSTDILHSISGNCQALSANSTPNTQKKRLNLHNPRFSLKLRLLNRPGWLPQMGNGVSFFFASIRCTLAVCSRNLTVLGHL